MSTSKKYPEAKLYSYEVIVTFPANNDSDADFKIRQLMGILTVPYDVKGRVKETSPQQQIK